MLKYSPVPDRDDSSYDSPTTSVNKMISISSRVHVSSTARLLLGLLVFCLVVWVLFSLLDGGGPPPLLKPGSVGDGDVIYGPVQPVRPPLPVETVRVDVYYECECPDSRYFVSHQLYPAFQSVGEVMEVHFIPYGKAHTEKTKHGYKFTCQHGQTECEGDIIHNCALDSIVSEKLRMEFINCMMTGEYYDKHFAQGEACANKLSLDWSDIKQCSEGRRGEELHAKAGEQTQSLSPRASFIPTIEMDGNQGSQKAILKKFLREFCKAYAEKTGEPGPKSCSDDVL